ncbi:MAG: dockerin type I repeat-containing protein [Candidatus Methanoplasma sp.]|jgi:hypothetical protein|nr:dockerin type I repeat-containing protein [Candidatus Methanoplasma sp.]
MLNTKTIVILVVAVVVVSSIGVAWFVFGDEGRDRIEIDAQLEVFGNANGDNTIDQADLDLIQDIIKGEKSFENYPLADADCNGVVNQLDYNLTNSIINASSNNRVRINILNHYDGGTLVETVMYPVTSAVATGAANTILIFKYLGIVNEIKGLSWAGAPDAFLFSEYQHLVTESKRLETSATRMSVEKVSELVTSDKVSAIVTADNRTYVTNAGTFKQMGVDTIRVTPAAVDSSDYMSTVLMIAFLFDTDGKGYMQKCSELISWYEGFFTDLNSKLDGVKKKASAVTSSSNTAVSSNTSDYTDVLVAAGAVFPITGIDWAGSASKSYDYKEDTWLNVFKIDYLIPIRTSVEGAFSWYEGTAITKGSSTLKNYMSFFQTLECYQKGNVYVVCGDMPVVLRIAYIAQILYPNIFGQDFAYNYNLEFVQKFFGWDESMVKNKPFYVSMSDVGL